MARILNSKRRHASTSTAAPTMKRGTDHFLFTVQRGHEYYGCNLTILESDRHSNAKVISQPVRGSRGKQAISVDWWHGVGDKVSYQLEAFSCKIGSPATNPSPLRCATGFVPSKHGFHFPNAFPSVPDITISTPLGKVEIGDASNGLCGGMVFFALDHFLAKRPVPEVDKPPVSGTLFEGIVKRLLNSFNLPMGLLNYIVLMDPDYPDGDEDRLQGRLVTPHGRAWQTIRVEWPIIKGMLDAGHPCPLGLIRIKSADLTKLGTNHQVLATGYDVTDDFLTLFIYDPNYPHKDNLSLKMSLSTPELATPITYSALHDLPVFAFFHVNYKFRAPVVDM